ncbi:MAG: hypothetical protein ABIF85_04755 [Nanoarchaeota archaeon]|nr:hypothetical protein [Nanoarchaeota archaeon]MBU4299598.1 hypothetical protein [Nanoarchaeota archaeon]MBU4451380.1 hypothetical protein [Nanoarchaeota archaeon]MCG2723417.1 hypothetical protein [archaeon]
MFKKRLMILCLLILLALPAYANAQMIDIALNQQEFKPDDEVRAMIVLFNPTNQQLKGDLIVTFASFNPDLPPAPFREVFDLAPGAKSNAFSFAMIIGDTMPDGLYRVDVELRDEKENIITQNYKEFKVMGTKKTIRADANICADEKCSERKVVFIAGETIYLKIDTLVQDIAIDATIKTPKGTVERVAFANNLASFKADEQGMHSVSYLISKKEYENLSITNEFSVLDAPANIMSVSDCNGNGICENNENIKTCPQDCPSGLEDGYCDKVKDNKCDPDCTTYEDKDCKSTETSKEKYYILIILVVLLVIAIAAYKKIQEKRKWKELEKKLSEKIQYG